MRKHQLVVVFINFMLLSNFILRGNDDLHGKDSIHINLELRHDYHDHVNVVESTGSINLDNKLAQEFQKLKAFFEIQGQYFITFEGRLKGNFLATKYGQVFIGYQFFKELLSEYGIEGVFAVLCHEAAHLRQFQYQYNREWGASMYIELEADALAGLCFSVLKYADHFNSIPMLQRLFNGLGDFDSDSVLHHGTPTQREQAFTEGLRWGLHKISRNQQIVLDEFHLYFVDWIKTQGW